MRTRSAGPDAGQTSAQLARSSPFALALGAYRGRLARPLADQFLGADGDHRVRLAGTMHQIWRRHGWLRPLFTMLACGAPSPSRTSDDSTRRWLTKEDSAWLSDWDRAEFSRFHGMFKSVARTRSKSRTGETCLRIGALRLRFPRFLRFTVNASQRARADGGMELDLVVTHPRLGRIFGYSGTFTVRREALDGAKPESIDGMSLDRYRPWFYAAAALRRPKISQSGKPWE